MSNVNQFQGAGFGALFDFSFRRFVTLGIVEILYMLLIAFGALVWLVGVGAGFANGGLVGGLISLIMMTVFFVIQVIVWRVMLELVVVLFRIAENTTTLVEHQTGISRSVGGFPVMPVAPASSAASAFPQGGSPQA